MSVSHQMRTTALCQPLAISCTAAWQGLFSTHRTMVLGHWSASDPQCAWSHRSLILPSFLVAGTPASSQADAVRGLVLVQRGCLPLMYKLLPTSKKGRSYPYLLRSTLPFICIFLFHPFSKKLKLNITPQSIAEFQGCVGIWTQLLLAQVVNTIHYPIPICFFKNENICTLEMKSVGASRLLDCLKFKAGIHKIVTSIYAGQSVISILKSSR